MKDINQPTLVSRTAYKFFLHSTLQIYFSHMQHIVFVLQSFYLSCLLQLQPQVDQDKIQSSEWFPKAMQRLLCPLNVRGCKCLSKLLQQHLCLPLPLIRHRAREDCRRELHACAFKFCQLCSSCFSVVAG